MTATRPLLLLSILVIFVFVCYMTLSRRTFPILAASTPNLTRSTVKRSPHPAFSLPPLASGRAHALGSILSLPSFLARNPNTLFNKLFEAEEKPARLTIPESFKEKALKMFAAYPTASTGNLSFLESQSLITTYNKYTDEYSIFNEVRRYRPGYLEKLNDADEAQLAAMVRDSAGPDKCDFCRKDRSAVDVFGRLEGAHYWVAANVAKFEQWHSLLVANVHDPLHIDADAIRDALLTAYRWFERVHEVDPDARYPHIMFDAGPRASASQVHQHMHLTLTHDRFHSKAEHTRQAAADYEEENPGRNFWRDVAEVHERLGLGVRFGSAMVLSHLCPIKERELVIVGSDAKDPAFAALVTVALKALKDDVGTRAFSMAVMFRPVGKMPLPSGPTEERAPSTSPVFPDQQLQAGTAADSSSCASPEGRSTRLFRSTSPEKARLLEASYPAVARIVDRGSPLDKRSDVGSMEFFGANNVGADPYHIMPFLRRRVAELFPR